MAERGKGDLREEERGRKEKKRDKNKKAEARESERKVEKVLWPIHSELYYEQSFIILLHERKQDIFNGITQLSF